MQPDFNQVTSLTELMNDKSISLLETSGHELVRKIGMDAVRTVVFDVLCGRNIRDSTETLTRYRLASLNAATVAMFLKGIQVQPNFVEQLPIIAERILKRKKLSKSERWVAQWTLGLTDKASQNVLRDDASLLADYRERYASTCEEVIKEGIENFGTLNGEICIDDKLITNLSWKFMVYLLGTVGAQTLTIRGSEKSAYGKLFERLVLGALLNILGFSYTAQDGPKQFKREFWLSSREEKRESDATVLWQAGKGVRFDIGFIGRGNTEISLDKVTRFTREIELGRSTWYMATIIIVDRIGKGSKIKDIARSINGDIVQMSMAYWPQEVARVLNDRINFQHPLLDMQQSEIRNYLRDSMTSVPLTDYLS